MSEELRDKHISDYIKKNNVTYRAAILAVSKQHPELFKSMYGWQDKTIEERVISDWKKYPRLKKNFKDVNAYLDSLKQLTGSNSHV